MCVIAKIISINMAWYSMHINTCGIIIVTKIDICSKACLQKKLQQKRLLIALFEYSLQYVVIENKSFVISQCYRICHSYRNYYIHIKRYVSDLLDALLLYKLPMVQLTLLAMIYYYYIIIIYYNYSITSFMQQFSGACSVQQTNFVEILNIPIIIHIII